jgi:hypothetical protein
VAAHCSGDHDGPSRSLSSSVGREKFRSARCASFWREIRRGIKLREDVIDALKLVSAQVVVAAQRAAHLVQVSRDLLERALDPGEQTRAFSWCGDEVFRAECFECRGVTIGRAPPGRDAVDAGLNHGALRLAVPCDERRHRARRRIAQREGRRIRGRSGQG